MAKILVADDEEGVRTFVADALTRTGHDVGSVENGKDALAAIEKSAFDLVISDLKMPHVDGMQLLTQVKAQHPEIEFIMMTAHGSVQTAVEAMKIGAFDYLQKPLSGPSELRLLVERALERRALLNVKAHRDTARETPTGAPPLSYGAPVMIPIVSALEKVARTHATVLLLGQSGTGKEVCARRIHQWSSRKDAPFIAINCAALTDTLLESTLFGHEKGAFTGADKRQRGQLELAEGGTFFLDEVGELRLELQAKLLRVLEERTFQRVGGQQLLNADVRFVTATNRNLTEMVSAGTFREDLYHRLAVFPVELPSLSERREDIPALARGLFARIAADMGRPTLHLDDDVVTTLAAMPWPGNIRQLKNTLERAAILCESDTVSRGDLWVDGGAANVPVSAVTVSPKLTSVSTSVSTSVLGSAAGKTEAKTGGATLADVEKTAVLAAMAKANGNRSEAAAALGISVRSLYDRLKRYADDDV